jgi:hypothetical protein
MEFRPAAALPQALRLLSSDYRAPCSEAGRSARRVAAYDLSVRWRSIAPLLVAAVAAVGGCGGENETYSVGPTSKCLSTTGVRVNWYEGAGEVDPFPTSGGTLVAFGVYKVTVRFAKDAAEAEAVAEKLEQYEYLDPFEGREYRFVVHRRGNAVVSAGVPKDEEPDERSLRDVLDAAERCLTAA